MSSTRVQTYCSQLYGRVHKFWKAQEGRYASWRNGYRVLYTPPKHRPPLLITGFQPGGDHRDRVDQELYGWPAGNEYLDQGWRLAKKLQRIFGDAGKLDLLRTCVGTNVVFFRSPNIAMWTKENPAPIRDRLERFSQGEFSKLVSCIEPQTILALGLTPFGMLAESGGDEMLNGMGKRIMCFGRFAGTPLVGLSLDYSLPYKDLVNGLVVGLPTN